MRIPVRLQPKQSLAFQTQANEILYGGAAGGGKSYLMRVVACYFAFLIPGVRIYLFRRTYDELIANHLEGPNGFQNMLSPWTKTGDCKIIRNNIKFRNGSLIKLCHCHNDKDRYRYQGHEIHILMMDELTHFSEVVYRFLRSRCRAPGLNIPENLKHKFPLIVNGSNPGGIGHQWVKNAFVKLGAMKKFRMPAVEGGMVRQFIPAKLEDNPAMLKDDPDYELKLEGLGDPALVRAMREGDWDIVAGSMFGDSWRKSVNGQPWHVIKPFPVPVDWKIWRGSDDGYVSPAACYWATQNPETKTFYILRELYRAKMKPSDFAKRVLEIDRSISLVRPDGDISYNDQKLTGYLDSSAFANDGMSDGPDTSRGKKMNALGTRWKPVPKWSGSRIWRVKMVHDLLSVNDKDPRKRPALRICDCCPNLIEHLPTLPRDEHNPEDIDTNALDHSFDGLTYCLQHKISRIKKTRAKGL